MYVNCRSFWFLLSQFIMTLTHVSDKDETGMYSALLGEIQLVTAIMCFSQSQDVITQLIKPVNIIRFGRQRIQGIGKRPRWDEYGNDCKHQKCLCCYFFACFLWHFDIAAFLPAYFLDMSGLWYSLKRDGRILHLRILLIFASNNPNFALPTPGRSIYRWYKYELRTWTPSRPSNFLAKWISSLRTKRDL